MPPSPAPDPNPAPETLTLPLPQARNLLASFSSFLTVATHNILYYRAIYPQRTFLSAKAFNLPVHQNRHPAVCGWVRDAVGAVTTQIADGAAARVGVVIHGPPHSNGAPPPPPQKGKGPAAAAAATAAAVASPIQPKKPADGVGQKRNTRPAPLAVLERWMFDVSSFPAWPGGADAMGAFDSTVATKMSEDDIPGDGDDPGGGGGGEIDSGEESETGDEDDAAALSDTGALSDTDLVNWADVDEQLRGALRRLAHTGEKLGPLPEGCTFTMAVELRDDAPAPIGHPQPWIPTEPGLQRKRPGRHVESGDDGRPRNRGRDLGGARTTAIRYVEAGPLFFECWVEEGKAKESLLRHRETRQKVINR